MMGDKIIQEIEYALKESNTKYSSWIIGIIGNPVRRRNEHRNEGKDTSS